MNTTLFQNFKTTLRNFEEAEKTEGNEVMNVKEKKFSGRPTAPLPRENKTRFDGACFSATNLKIVENHYVGAETATTKVMTRSFVEKRKPTTHVLKRTA